MVVKVGITISDLENYDKKLYSSGIDQHIMMFYNYLSTITKYQVYLVSQSSNNKFRDNYIDFVDGDKLKNLDILICVGLELPHNGVEFCKNNKIKTVVYCLGHQFIMDMSNILSCNNKKKNSPVYDDVWILPDYANTIDYYKYKYLTNDVKISPFFWSPLNVGDRYLNPINYHEMNVAVIESNFVLNKSCFVPIMICEKAKNIINNAKIFGARKLYDNSLNFKTFLQHSSMFREKRLIIEHRKQFKYIMDNLCNVVISYTDDWDLNFVHLECFYLGIPLIHNSKMLKDWGFYYETMNVEEAYKHLKWLSDGNFNRQQYIERHKPILEKYSMRNPENIDFFDKNLQLPSLNTS